MLHSHPIRLAAAKAGISSSFWMNRARAMDVTSDRVGGPSANEYLVSGYHVI